MSAQQQPAWVVVRDLDDWDRRQGATLPRLHGAHGYDTEAEAEYAAGLLGIGDRSKHLIRAAPGDTLVEQGRATGATAAELIAASSARAAS